MKRGRLLIALILLVVLVSSLVIAQVSGTLQTWDEEIVDVVDSVVRSASVATILHYLVGETPGGQLLFIKVLFLILLIAIIKFAVDKVPALSDNKAVAWIIAIAASMIGIRFLSTEALVNFIWLPTGVLGVVLATIMPFIIFLFFIESFDNSIIRKVGWITFAVIFFGLAIYRWDTLSTGAGFLKNLGWMYVIIGVLSILAIIFDKTIRAKIIMSAIQQKGAELNVLNISNLQTQIQNWKNVISNQASTPQQVDTAKGEIKNLEKRIAAILKS